jgi:hypothetical protein
VRKSPSGPDFQGPSGNRPLPERLDFAPSPSSRIGQLQLRARAGEVRRQVPPTLNVNSRIGGRIIRNTNTRTGEMTRQLCFVEMPGAQLGLNLSAAVEQRTFLRMPTRVPRSSHHSSPRLAESWRA